MRPARWIGVAVVVAIAAIVIVLFARSPRGPETVARQFLDALLQAPEDTARLRAAAHLAESDDPEALLEGLSTRVALEFLRARERQGAVHDVSIAETRRPAPQRYVAVLRVVENADGAPVQSWRFQVSMQTTDDGDWRIVAVALSE